MTLALVVAHDATPTKPAPVPVPGAARRPHLRLPLDLPDGLTTEDATRISDAIAAGRAESTRKTYASAWRRLERWCAERSITSMPATSTTVCA